MIKRIIRITCWPIQTIFDGIRHKQGHQKMMAYVLKINQNSKYSEMAGV